MAGRGLGWREIDIVEVKESRAEDADKRLIEQSISLANLVPADSATVLLDPKGENLDSGAMTACLAKWRGNNRTAAVFMIGGPDGLAETLSNKAALRLSFWGGTLAAHVPRATAL